MKVLHSREIQYMQKIKCYPSSSIGPCPTLCDNFAQHEESVSVYWDDAPLVDDGAFLRVFHHCEPPEVFPSMAAHIIANQGFFDVIMSYDPRVLRECGSKAVFLTESACSWLDRKSSGSSKPFIHNFPDGPAPLSPVVENYISCDVSKKEFAVSFLTSSKNQFPGHSLRQEIYDSLPDQVGAVRTWKHRSPPRIEDKRTVTEPYQYHICPENSRHEGYYTEKIVDCFVAKTIPVYWGCPDIDRHFNRDGIVIFDSYEDLLRKLQGLTPGFYQERATAIEENFHRALQGVRQWDQIESHINEGIRKKKDSGHESSPQSVHTNPQSVPRPLRWVPRKSR
jgi:Glycosyltransferase family 10 (fucosyltransferase) C-term